MHWMDAWLFPLGAVALGGLGLLLLVRGLFGRRFMVRKARACRRCRYDMGDTEGHRCPECGHTAKHEGEHYAGRRRWLVAGLGLMLLLGAVGVGMTPGVRRDGWLRLLPLELQVRVFHLETNDGAYAALVEQVHVSKGFRGGGRAPGFGPGSTLPAINPDRMERLLPVLHRTAIKNLRRRNPSERAVLRSFAMIERYTMDQLSDEERAALVESFGVAHRSVQQMLTRYEVEPDSALARARREAFEFVGSSRRDGLGWSMVRYPGGDEDAPLIGAWLATPEYNGDPGHEYAKSRIRDDLGDGVPDAAYPVYAGLIRADGACGNYKTLVDAMKVSPAVAGAAVDWTLALDEGDERTRWIEVLAQITPEYDAGKIDADWGVARAIAEGERKLYNAREEMRLMRRLDAGMGAWLIGHARDPDSPHRQTALYELSGARHRRADAVDFAFGEAWEDESISLNHRMWPLVKMEAWYGDEIPTEMDLAAYWGEVLDWAAAGDLKAFEEGLPRFRKGTYGQSVFALIAVGRRLVEDRTIEPWLEQLAEEIAESCGEEASVGGFAAVLRAGADAWVYNANQSRVPGAEALDLAARIGGKFGALGGVSGGGSP